MSLRLVHDLPPRWDGYPVVWRGWSSPIVIICGKVPEHCCVACGSRRDPSINFGLVGESDDMTRAAVRANDKACGSWGAVKTGPRRRSWIRLSAFRCPDCGHDEIVDEAGDVWTLDPDDYLEAGSFADA